MANLLDAKYDELEPNHRKVYDHYYKCLMVVTQVTTLLITKLNEELEQLQPLLLDHSYDSKTYKKIKRTIKLLTKQIKGFETRIVPDFNGNLGGVLPICNNIKKLREDLMEILSADEDIDLSNTINLIFSESLIFSDLITQYTRQCTLDQRLFKESNDMMMEQVIQKNNLFREENIEELHQSIEKQRLNDKKLYSKPLRHKEYLPKKLKIKVNELLHMLSFEDFENSLVDNSTAMAHRNSVEEEYNSLIPKIRDYLDELVKLILIFLMDFQEMLSTALLDCDLFDECFKEYHALTNRLQKFYNSNKGISEDELSQLISQYQKLINQIMNNNPSLSQLDMYYETIFYFQAIIERINFTLSDLNDLYLKHKDLLYSYGIEENKYDDGYDDNEYDDYDYDDYDDVPGFKGKY